MATKKRTTPLKAKTARRTEPKRKAKKRAKETCPVLLAMQEAGDLCRYYNLISDDWERQSKTRQEEISAQCDALADRLRGKWDAISHLQAHGAKGALYQILVARHAISWAHTVQDADQRAWYRRRALRCLERAFSTLHAQAVPPNWSVHWGIKGWLMPTDEEQAHLAWSGMRAAMQIVEERKAASEAAS